MTSLLLHQNLEIMKAEIKTAIQINATKEKVWSILTNFKDYKNWNPFIKNIEGNPEIGKRIKADIQPPNSQKMTFKPKVLAFEINKEFRWKGNFLIPGLFDGEHIFEIIENDNNSVTFNHSEKFNGILVPIFLKQLNQNTKLGFEAMNQKLKELAEN